MAYTATDKILADHYNTFVAGAGTFGIFNHDVANINTVWGVGFNDKGYGQSNILTQVPVGTVVSATQWTTLFDRLNSAAIHQATSQEAHPGNGVLVASNVLVVGIEYEIVTAGTGDWTTVGAGDSNPGTTFRATGTTNGQSDGTANQPTIVGGDLITAITTLQSNVDDVFANRLNAIANVSTQVEAAAGSDPWDVTSVHTINVQFASEDQARYFFNAGGTIALTFSRTGGDNDAKNDSWDDGGPNGVLPESGTVIIGEHGTTKSGGSGVLNTDYFIEAAIGYYELGTGAIQLFKQFALGGGGYPTEFIEVDVATNGVQGPSGDNGDLITFTVTMTDDVGAGDPVNGTTTATATVNFPETTNLTASWGVVTFIPASGVVQT